MTVEELIERLGKAEGPTFVLDEAIHAWRLADMPEADRPFPPKSYTSSIDAALTLVPEGWRWIARCRDPGEHGDFARVESADFKSVCWEAGGTISTDVLSGDDATGRGATPAISICIAALRARSSVKG